MDIISAATLLFLVMDPLGNVPIYLSVLDKVDPARRTRVVVRELLLALAVLVGSSKLLVWGAVNIAVHLGISELVIGLTIVAIGTSLPELAASVAGARKGELEMVMGNVIGSNLFNTLGVIGIPALLIDFDVSPVAVTRDLPIMLALTAVLFLMSHIPRRQCCILTRFKGAILLSGFVLYQSLLYYQVVSAN